MKQINFCGDWLRVVHDMKKKKKKKKTPHTKNEKTKQKQKQNKKTMRSALCLHDFEIHTSSAHLKDYWY